MYRGGFIFFRIVFGVLVRGDEVVLYGELGFEDFREI